MPEPAHSRRPGYPSSGCSQWSPGKRANDRSHVYQVVPCSIASAARYASRTAFPRASVPAPITGIRAAETFAPAGAGIAGVARARHDEIVAELHAALGEQAFAAAAARGAAMSDEEALTFLLEELERVRAALGAS